MSATHAPLMPCLDILQRLKDGTQDVHQRIHGRVPIFRPGFNVADYASLVERFYGFWSPLEISLSQLSGLAHPELELASRLKSSLLENDLMTLGREPQSVPLCQNLPVTDSFHKGLGCLYVLEGSTLGARFISAHLEKELQLDSHSGASFFSAYGDSVGLRWNAFRSFVTASVSEENSTEVVTAARTTFQCFFDWLEDLSPPPHS